MESTSRARGAARAAVVAGVLLASAALAQSASEPARAGLPPRPTLTDALAATLLSSPELDAFSLEERARDAALLQAGAWPNPELAVEVEDVAGSGDFAGTSEAQTTVGLFQRFELGGDRAARRALAESERALAGFDYAARRLDVLAGTANAFVDALAAQERLALAEETLRLARLAVDEARARTRAGLGTAGEEARAALVRAQAEAALARDAAAATTARTRLAALCGQPGAPIETLAGSLAPLPPLPDLASLRARLAEGPALARFESERAEREARVALERARRIPDLTLNAGVRRLSGPDDTSLVVGALLPIPVWDRHDGAIAEAEYRVAKLSRERVAVERALGQQLAEAHAALAAARLEAESLEATVLPPAQQALGQVSEAYRAGIASQRERLDAERVLQDVHAARLRALAEARHRAVELDRLTASLDLDPRAPGAPREESR